MKILVMGSINIDNVLYVHNFPNRGETIDSIESLEFSGGKGANQAIAISRLSKNDNNQIYFFGKVGNDIEGNNQIKKLNQNKINTNFITRSKKATGKAMILISETDNDNMIIIHKGANSDINKNNWKELEKAIIDVDIVVLQLEVNEDAVDKALELTHKHNKKVIMNPTPAKSFKTKWLPKIDWLVPNETELELISNILIDSILDIENSIKKLRNFGLNKILVTLGDAGIYVDDSKFNFRLPAKRVKVVDTTAAGDTFIGAFVSSGLIYDGEKELKKIIKFAINAAAKSVQAKGAQASIPYRKEVTNEKK